MKNIKQEIHNLNSKLNSIRRKLIKNPKSVRLLHIEMEIIDRLKKLGIVFDPKPKIENKSKKDILDLVAVEKFISKKPIFTNYNSSSVQKFDKMCSQYK